MAPLARGNGESGCAWRGYDPIPAAGRHWAVPSELVTALSDLYLDLPQHEKLDAFGRFRGVIEVFRLRVAAR